MIPLLFVTFLACGHKSSAPQIGTQQTTKRMRIKRSVNMETSPKEPKPFVMTMLEISQAQARSLRRLKQIVEHNAVMLLFFLFHKVREIIIQSEEFDSSRINKVTNGKWNRKNNRILKDHCLDPESTIRLSTKEILMFYWDRSQYYAGDCRGGMGIFWGRAVPTQASVAIKKSKKKNCSNQQHYCKRLRLLGAWTSKRICSSLLQRRKAPLFRWKEDGESF